MPPYTIKVQTRETKTRRKTIMMKEIVKAIFEVLVNGQAVVKELNEL
ncbi:hypothetical protein [Bacillus nitratireducens]|nr:hypothetical protein [Bacillus nitratireducens]